jgi:hypothetical protein
LISENLIKVITWKTQLKKLALVGQRQFVWKITDDCG